MGFSAAQLRAALEAQLPPNAAGLVVALSGGADSACLLAASAQLAPAFRALPLRAVHVDHGLQEAAAGFQRDSGALAARFGVPLSIHRVQVDCRAGESVEAAARDARYAALGADLRPDECLLTAHHCEDQAETLLLQALRGAGLKGLSCMPVCRPLGAGWHLRPLLGVTRRELCDFGAGLGLAERTDPMNLDLRFDRNYLRHRIWPPLQERWPGLSVALARTAHHVAEGSELLEQIAAEDFAAVRDGDALSAPRLRRLPQPRQVNLMRHFIAVGEAAALSSARLREALRQLMDAAADQQPTILWDGYALRRYRERILLTAAERPRLQREYAWNIAADAVLDLGAGLGRLRRVEHSGGWAARKLPAELRIVKRRGGETLKPAAHAATRSVQHLCQSLGVLPWMRDALPFIYAGEALIGVADHWRDARWCAARDEPGLACIWEDAPIHL
jgi:tRNA(Ile)-lysidine synthase